MNSKLIVVVSIFVLITISGCTKNTETNTDKSQETKSNEVIIDSSTIDSSDIDDIRKEEPSNTVSQLRRKLYEAGVNSSQITDSMLEQYEKEAAEKNIDFAEYVREEVNK
ncbi:hypothetical protein [Enterococcus sp. LJL51]|uniref:hypothetical protein n=1 Tax=Enterococcus sp. LJL51 TaxID=3416656 RepID=UPI003CE84215